MIGCAACPVGRVRLVVRVLRALCFLSIAASEQAIAQTNSQTITDLTETSLVQALQKGGYIEYGTDGTVLVTNSITISSNAILDGAGHKITISGGGAGPMFDVSAGFNFSLNNLTVANTTNNGDPPPCCVPVTVAAYGGAISNAGTLFVNNCIFSNNVAHGGPTFWPELMSGSPGQGGAIYNSGLLAVSNSLFTGNSATGGMDNGGSAFRGLAGGSAGGGAIFNDGGTLVLNTVTFSDNAAIGAPPAPADSGVQGTGGSAAGGAVFSSGGNISAWNITVASNSAVGQGAAVPEDSTFVGGIAGAAYAGALCIDGGTAVISNSIISNNLAVGGTSDSGFGGQGAGGGVFNAGSTLLAQCDVEINTAAGGGYNQIVGGGGGQVGTAEGLGGGIFNTGSIQITGSIISANMAQGGTGTSQYGPPPEPPSMGVGGAIYNSGVVLVSESTLAKNSAVAAGYAGAEGGAIANVGVAQLQTTILSSNAAVSGLDLGDAIYNTGAFLTDTGSIIQPGVSGTAPFTYDWQVDRTNIADATLATFNLTNFQFGIAGTNSLINSSPTTSLTNIEILNLPLTNAPSFVVQPASEPATVGASVELSAAAVGFPVPAYQWQLNGANVTRATANVLLLPDVQLNQAGTYTVIATNIYGTVTSQPVALTFQGVALTATNLGNGTFSISGAGLPGMSFILEESTNLTDWQPIQTNMSPWSIVFSSAPTTLWQFFRAVLAP